MKAWKKLEWGWWSEEDEKTNGSKLKDYMAKKREASPNEPNHNHSSFPRASCRLFPFIFLLLLSFHLIFLLFFHHHRRYQAVNSVARKNSSSLWSFVFTQHGQLFASSSLITVHCSLLLFLFHPIFDIVLFYYSTKTWINMMIIQISCSIDSTKPLTVQV